MDRRTTPANERVAATYLRGKVDAARYTDGQAGHVSDSYADLRASPDGPRDRQLLFGASVTVFDTFDGWSFVQSNADDYVGYVQSQAITIPPNDAPTHIVMTPATHAYTAPDLKSPESKWLSMGCHLPVLGQSGTFLETPVGFVPENHLREIDQPEEDPAAVARRLTMAPYLWGGNTSAGIDCSGLVQLAFTLCAIACPADSDQQRIAMGEDLAKQTPPRRNDLFFWPGHVALTISENKLIHANAHHMAVTVEDITEVMSRIDQAGDGPLVAHKRLSSSLLKYSGGV